MKNFEEKGKFADKSQQHWKICLQRLRLVELESRKSYVKFLVKFFASTSDDVLEGSLKLVWN